jgi:nicotinamidase-related amidase
LLKTQSTVLVVVDVQEKLAGVMHDRERFVDAAERLIRGARVLEVPVIWLEQNPQRLGPTVPQLAGALEGLSPIPKMCFDCCDSEAFLSSLAASRRRQVLLAGIEAHICVYQTAMGLLARGFEVHVATDAVSSRTESNRGLALARMRDLGAVLTGVEMALYEMLRVAEGDRFKAILKIVK